MRKIAARKFDITAERVLQQLAAIAFANSDATMSFKLRMAERAIETVRGLLRI